VLSKIKKSHARLAKAAAHSRLFSIQGLENKGKKLTKANKWLVWLWNASFGTLDQLQDKKLSLATKYYSKNINELQVPEGKEDVEVKMAKLRKDRRYRCKLGTGIKESRTALDKLKTANSSSVSTSAWEEISEEMAICLADDFLDQQQPRREAFDPRTRGQTL
jgi:hypothetical protein